LILLKITAARTGFGIAKGAAKFSGNLMQATGRGVGNLANAGCW